MVYAEIFRYFIGNRPVFDQVQVVKSYIVRRCFTLQPALGHGADRTPGTVFENDYRLAVALGFDCV